MDKSLLAKDTLMPEKFWRQEMSNILIIRNMTRLTSVEAGYFLTDLFPLLVGILLVLVLNHHQTSHHLFLQTTNTSLDATLSSRIQSRTDWRENCWFSSFVLDTFIVVVGVVMLVMLVCWHNRSVYGDRDLLPGRRQSKAATSQVAGYQF